MAGMWRCLGRTAAVFIALNISCCTGRIVSVPDLHGDFSRAKQILIAANLVDKETLHWIGGDATLIQTGDIIDRGDHGKRIYELFRRLSEEAPLAGGAVINLLGNHELLNLQNDLRYVSAGDIAEFGGPEERSKAFGPDGWLGSWIRQLPVATVVGGVLFVHAGVLPGILKHGGVEDLNRAFKSALSQVDAGGALGSEAEELFGEEGPVWVRDYAFQDSARVCHMARQVLAQVGAVRMVVGHTIQADHHVHTHCGGQVVLGDTGVSSVYRGSMSFQEHDGNGGVTILYPGTAEQVQLPALQGAASSLLQGAARKVPQVSEPERHALDSLAPAAILGSVALAVALFIWRCHAWSWKSRMM